MYLISYLSSQGPRAAAVRDKQCFDLHRADPSLPASINQLLGLGPEGLRRAETALAHAAPLAPDEFRPAPPVPRPEKILCVGLNYADHAFESGMAPPSEPVLFCKLPSTVIGDWQPIVLPRVSQEVDYEAELVVVIGRGGRHIPREKALRHVAGYCCGNDVSARDWQLHKPGGQWLLGKTFDSFAPIGPAIVTADEVPDPHNLKILLRLNGQVMQKSCTDQLIFPVDYLVSYISDVCTLAPGDLIFTGTPPGVGFARRPPVFLKPGDVVEVEIEKLGVLRNPVAAESDS
ncbi:MAG: fumarylacetoacetate hydrolase family protein [Pirellulales bacterium]|nr:fumarylacetoacetate hydrolase family protein [Pirellulales bacterium]